MSTIFDTLSSQAVSIFGRILFAVIVFFAGRLLVRQLLKMFENGAFLSRMDGAVRTFIQSFAHFGLYCVLAIIIVNILGVPMTSISALIASAGVAVGLAMQGGLSNLAGGIMLIIFKPFKLEDYIETCGITGTAKEINLFYTVIVTPDNKRITVPNGNLMNATIIDYSAESLRRAEVIFTCARSESPARVQELMLKAMEKTERILPSPEAPFARLTGSTGDALEFTARAWCTNADYLDVLYDLNQNITEALQEAGVKTPAVRVSADA